MHLRLGVTVLSLLIAGALLGFVGSAFAETGTKGIGNVGSIWGTFKAYTSSHGSEVATSVSGSDMKGQRIHSEQNGRYEIHVGGIPYWVDKYQVSIDRELAVPPGCQNLATSFAGNSAPRGAGPGCEE